MDELRAAVRELAIAPGAEQADALVEAVGRAAPSPELVALISETLEMPALSEVSDSRGVPLRWRLIDRLLALGFPHALHVTPEDLDYHSSRGASRAGFAAPLTVAVALVSLVWSVLWGLLIVSFGGGWQSNLAGLAMLAAFAHAVLAFFAAVAATTGAGVPLLKKLGWAFFAWPAAVVVATALDASAAYAAVFIGLPMMATALLCALTAALYQPGLSSVTFPAAREPVDELERAEPARVAAR